MTHMRFYLFLGFLLIFGSIPAIHAPGPLAVGKGTGLPLPRFVSLRAGEVNLRTGPGVQYPVDWVYLRKNLPPWHYQLLAAAVWCEEFVLARWQSLAKRVLGSRRKHDHELTVRESSPLRPDLGRKRHFYLLFN